MGDIAGSRNGRDGGAGHPPFIRLHGAIRDQVDELIRQARFFRHNGLPPSSPRPPPRNLTRGRRSPTAVHRRARCARQARAGADLGEVADARHPKSEAPALSRTPRPIRGLRQCLLAADGDVLQDRHLIADDGECADDNAGGMIEKHLRSDRGRGMNADLKGVGRQALQQGSARSVRSRWSQFEDPERGLQRDIALEGSIAAAGSFVVAGCILHQCFAVRARVVDQIG